MHKRRSIHGKAINGQLEVNLSSQQGRSIKDVWLEVPERLVVCVRAAGCVWQTVSGRINKRSWGRDSHAGTRVMSSEEESAEALSSPSIHTAVRSSSSHLAGQRIHAIGLRPWLLPPGGCADVAKPMPSNHLAINLPGSKNATKLLFWHIWNLQREKVCTVRICGWMRRLTNPN